MSDDLGAFDNVGWRFFMLPGERKRLREAELARRREMTELDEEDEDT